MKKTLTFIILTLVTFVGTQAQTTYKVRQNFNQPITYIELGGTSSLKVIHDTMNYLELTNVNGEKPTISKKGVIIEGPNITIEDYNNGNVYSLHTNSPKQPTYMRDMEAYITFIGFPEPKNFSRTSVTTVASNPNNVESYTIVSNNDNDSTSTTTITYTIGDSTYTKTFQGDTSASQAVELLTQTFGQQFPLSPSDKAELKRMAKKINHDTLSNEEHDEWDRILSQVEDYINQIDNSAVQVENYVDKSIDTDSNNRSTTYDGPFTDSFSNLMDSITTLWGDRKAKRGYNNADRTDWDFLWGWTNLGHDNLIGDPFGMGADTYEPRTTFSSYQIGFNYAVVMTRHWQLKLGFNYESDVYKINLLNTTTNTTTNTTSTISEPGKLVARYLSLPITLGYRSNDRMGHFRIDLAAVPGYCIYSNAKFGPDYDNVNNVASMLNPYKLDVRFDIAVGGIKFFVQVPTLPVFKGNNLPKIYPVTFGFMI